MQDGKPVILYVDDDPDYLENMRMILEANDYIMVEASNAKEGLDVYEKEKPDFIILDMMMEDSDSGAQVARELKARRTKAPVYILSSIGESLSMNTNFSELGLNGIFQKPISADLLLSVLRKSFQLGN